MSRILNFTKLTEDEIEFQEPTEYTQNVEFKGELNKKELEKNYQSVTFSVLEPGNVFTIEPGIYFIDTLINEAKNSETKKHFYDFDLIEKYRVDQLKVLTLRVSVEFESKIVFL